MTDLKLYSKISTLPESLKKEVVSFIDSLESKNDRKTRIKKKGRKFGYAKNSITLHPDFDEPLEDFEDYM